MKKIKNFYLEFFILIIYLLLLCSEWIANYIWQPVGIRHIYLISIPFFIFLIGKNKHILINKNTLKFLLLIVLFFIILSSITKELNLATFLGWFFTYFFFINYFLISIIPPFRIDIEKIFKFIIYINFIASLFPFFDFIVNSVSLRESTGVFRDSSAFASIMLISVFLCYYFIQKNNQFIWKLFLYYFSLIILITTMKKTILILAFFWLLKFFPKLNFVSKFISLIFISFIILFTSNNLIENINDVLYYENNVDPSEHVRWGMYIGAFKLQNNYFPFGSGFSTFGSLFSIYDIKSGKYIMNKTYYDLELNNLADNEARLENGRTTFLDTYYPHILGEGGVLQILLIFVVLIYILKKVKITCLKNSNIYLYSLFLWVTIMIFIDGITIISPEMPLFIFFFSTLTAFINKAKVEF